jgi:hypothetical protein
VGEVLTFRASDTNIDLPTVSTSLFNGFQYLNNRFITSKSGVKRNLVVLKMVEGTVARDFLTLFF